MSYPRTRNLSQLCRTADILVVAVGKAGLVKADWVKPGAVVIDCGINSVEDSSKKAGYRLVGDVAYDEVVGVASAVTPVPGGVGPMTVAMLMHNTVQAAVKAHGQAQKADWSLSLLPLHPLDKVETESPKNINKNKIYVRYHQILR